MSEKIIDNIKPYNDIFYNNCFYSSFFPVVEHFDKDISHFLTNDIIVYSLNNQDNMLNLNIEYVPVKDIYMLADEVGLSCERKANSGDIVEDIILSIQKDTPVIIWVDCFYESMRNDTYLKLHWPHSWLIFGFDLEEKIFHVIEHNHKEYLTYDKRKISFEDTIISYNGFMDNFQKDYGIESFFAFSTYKNNTNSENNPQSALEHMTTFLTNMNKKKKELLLGLEHLETFMNFIVQVVSADELDMKKIEILVGVLNNIVRAKQVEKYRLSRFSNNINEKAELIEEIIKKWSSIRTMVAKTMYSQSLKNSSSIALRPKLELIFNLECKYYRSF